MGSIPTEVKRFFLCLVWFFASCGSLVPLFVFAVLRGTTFICTLTFKCARARCKTCPFICNVEKLSGPKRSIKITDHFTCTSANVIYCITCTLCKKLYIGETGRRLGDRFREHLRDVEKDDKNASKPVARHFNLPNHLMQHMTVCGLSLHQGNTESRKTLEQKFIFQIGTLNPDGINERFSFN